MSHQITHANRIFSQPQLPMLGLALSVFVASVGWTQDNTDSVDVPAAAVVSGAEPGTEDGDDSPLMPPGEVPSSAVTPEAGAPESGAPESGAPESSTPEEMPPLEYNEEEKALIAKFEAEQSKLAAQMGDMREIYVKFMNGIDSSRDAESRYREARNSVRKQFNATYDSAIEIIRRVPHDVAVQYIATWIQNREANDIYDRDTFEGAARLIDGGINYMFLFLAGARSAVVSGDFKQANCCLSRWISKKWRSTIKLCFISSKNSKRIGRRNRSQLLQMKPMATSSSIVKDNARRCCVGAVYSLGSSDCCELH